MNHTADSIEYGQNMLVNFNKQNLDVVSDHLTRKLQRDLKQQEAATTALLAGFSLGLLSAVIIMSPSSPQQPSPPSLASNSLTEAKEDR